MERNFLRRAWDFAVGNNKLREHNLPEWPFRYGVTIVTSLALGIGAEVGGNTIDGRIDSHLLKVAAGLALFIFSGFIAEARIESQIKTSGLPKPDKNASPAAPKP